MMTLKKISHVTGYSVSTVSKAMNNKHDINVNTRRIIQEFAFKNNYVPNKNAIALRRSKSHIVAVILPQINDTFYGEVLYDMQRIAAGLGYRIMLFQSFENILKEKEYLDEVNDGSIDGAIVLSINKIEIKDSYNKINTIPIEYIQISKNQSHDILKENCISNFGNLLKQIK